MLVNSPIFNVFYFVYVFFLLPNARRRRRHACPRVVRPLEALRVSGHSVDTARESPLPCGAPTLGAQEADFLL